MVSRLEGSVNGQAIILYHREGDWWDAVIPPAFNGVCVVELTAYDDAGNVGHAAKYIITIDLSSLCVHIELYPYQCELITLWESELIELGEEKNAYESEIINLWENEIWVSDFKVQLV